MNNELQLSRRIDALFLQDDRGRITGINEVDSNVIVPRLYILRTANHCLWRIGADVPDAIASQLEDALNDEPSQANFRDSLVHYQAYLNILEQDTPISNMRQGPAYYFSELMSSDKAVLITEDNQSLLEKHFPYTLEVFASRYPITVMVADGSAVAACFCSRKTPYVAEAGVYTVDEYRKRGFAKEVVQRWAYAVQQVGLQALYSTDWDNIASQRIAASLGAVSYGVDFSFR